MSEESNDSMGKEERKDRESRWALEMGMPSLKIPGICPQDWVKGLGKNEGKMGSWALTPKSCLPLCVSMTPCEKVIAIPKKMLHKKI